MSEMMPEDPMPDMEMPPFDLTRIMMRQLAWDTLPCDEVPGVLAKLGLTPSSAEGVEIEHENSHGRIGKVVPLEPFLIQAASVLGTVLAMAMTENKGVTESLGDDGMDSFAEQNAEVVLTSCRAVVAQLIDEGVLMYTPEALIAVAGL